MNAIYSDLSETRKYIKFFYLLGQSPSIVPANQNPFSSKFKRFLDKLPSILFIITTLILYVSGTVIQAQFALFINDIVAHMYLALETTTNIIIFTRCFTHENALQSIIEHFRFLKGFFHAKFNHQIVSSRHLKRIQFDLLLCCFTYIGSVVMNFVLKFLIIDRDDGYAEFFIDLLQLPTILCKKRFFFLLCKISL